MENAKNQREIVVTPGIYILINNGRAIFLIKTKAPQEEKLPSSEDIYSIEAWR